MKLVGGYKITIAMAKIHAALKKLNISGEKCHSLKDFFFFFERNLKFPTISKF